MIEADELSLGGGGALVDILDIAGGKPRNFGSYVRLIEYLPQHQFNVLINYSRKQAFAQDCPI